MKKISVLPVSTSDEKFYSSIKVWDQRPNVLDKRIFGAEVTALGKFENERDIELLVKNFFSLPEKPNNSLNLSEENISLCEPSLEVFSKTLIWKKKDDLTKRLELSVYDYKDKCIKLIQNPEKFYSIRYNKSTDCIELLIPETSEACDFKWECEILLPKIQQWCQNSVSSSISSLELISVEAYCENYYYLKGKYVKNLKEVWTECTDPDKFIHEDIAIAAYLITFWGGNGKQKFIDLGCGNGLLVYILNGEGHQGIGYDLRSRKIWSSYPSFTVLEEKEIFPSIDFKLKETDWLIGNHSDELTLWVPVFASLNSYNTKFFLLPCCSFNLDGSKFKRTNSSRSQYEDFMTHVQSVSEELGFIIKKDRLRIPSTKRICFIATGRNYSLSQWPSFPNGIIDKLCTFNQVTVRPQIEPVTNCTALKPEIKYNLLKEITSLLLESDEMNDGWNSGNPIHLTKLAASLTPDLAKALKKESKGLQTFLKNHRHIFKLENGIVTFRKPELRVVEIDNLKKKECWFYKNHPNSCPLTSEQCTFIH